MLGTAELKSLLPALHTKLEATELAACNLSFHSWPGNNQRCWTEKKFGHPGEAQTGLGGDGEEKCGPHGAKVAQFTLTSTLSRLVFVLKLKTVKSWLSATSLVVVVIVVIVVVVVVVPPSRVRVCSRFNWTDVFPGYCCFMLLGCRN